MFDVLDMGASGLMAQRVRMDTIAQNIANINTTHNAKGEKIPYRRRFVVLAEGRDGDTDQPGVHVEQVGQDMSPSIRKVFDPNNTDADAQGYVHYPNVDLSTEFVNAIEASRAYEANATMLEVSKAMINSSLRIIA